MCATGTAQNPGTLGGWNVQTGAPAPRGAPTISYGPPGPSPSAPPPMTLAPSPPAAPPMMQSPPGSVMQPNAPAPMDPNIDPLTGKPRSGLLGSCGGV